MIPYTKHYIDDSDVRAVAEVLTSGFITQGPKVKEFEDAICQICNSKYAVATSSATTALHLAYLSLGVGTGDFVWTSAITFAATASAAKYCGANIDFVDIDPKTNNLSVSHLEQKLMLAERTGKLPKVVVPVHLAGLPCDMDAIFLLSKKYGFRVIEDASHALGATFLNSLTGSSQYSDITILSFHPAKIITSGEGGCALTADIELAEKMRLLRVHAITREPTKISNLNLTNPCFYEQVDVGYNYRMSDIHAALGLSQLKKLDLFIKRRREIACFYSKNLDGLGLKLPSTTDDRLSSYHLYVIEHENSIGSNQAKLMNQLIDHGIGVNLHYMPLYRHPIYKSQFDIKNYPNSEAYFHQAISIPMYYGITDEQLSHVVQSIRKLVAV
jgi:UDP-4-amino-4,6-dideoxy-N-acetyl-beta-L-altrosamine transaminase